MIAVTHQPHIRLGTRGSPLALWQAHWVADALRAHHAGLTTDIVVIRTAGDRNRTDPLPSIGGKGLFVTDIENALLRHDIDIAVHSLKDMPTDLPHDLHLGAVPLRADVHDAFVGRDGRRLTEVDGPWRIGTSSLRRQAQLRALHSALQVQDIRGNVDTRLRKMRQGEADGVVLAAAGLIRLGLADDITELLPFDLMLPPAGQGALALETQVGHWVDELLEPLHDPPTAHAVTAERAFLAHLGGGCSVPIAALAQCHDGQLHLRGLVSTPVGDHILRDDVTGPETEAEQLGAHLAARLRGQGAAAILEALEEERE